MINLNQYSLDYDLVNKELYNEFIQRCQREAYSFALINRIRPIYYNEKLIAGYFEVFWENWHIVAEQHHPFTPKSTYKIKPVYWQMIQYNAAGSLINS